ncbi:hypothetical protein QQP08_003708 [Theobroma cacao]|nr:hypothetical protein QQP08_003708 [Theobroma cacao]
MLGVVAKITAIDSMDAVTVGSVGSIDSMATVLLGSATRRSGAQDVTEIITRDLYETMFKHRNGFYTYDAFVAAA